MFGFIKKHVYYIYNNTKRVALNKKRGIQPNLFNLHPNKYNQELHYYAFVVN